MLPLDTSAGFHCRENTETLVPPAPTDTAPLITGNTKLRKWWPMRLATACAACKSPGKPLRFVLLQAVVMGKRMRCQLLSRCVGDSRHQIRRKMVNRVQQGMLRKVVVRRQFCAPICGFKIGRAGLTHPPDLAKTIGLQSPSGIRQPESMRHSRRSASFKEILLIINNLARKSRTPQYSSKSGNGEYPIIKLGHETPQHPQKIVEKYSRSSVQPRSIALF